MLLITLILIYINILCISTTFSLSLNSKYCNDISFNLCTIDFQINTSDINSSLSLSSQWLSSVESLTCDNTYVSSSLNSSTLIFSQKKKTIEPSFFIVSCTFYFSALTNNILTSIKSRKIDNYSENDILFPSYIFFVQNVKINSTNSLCSDQKSSYCQTNFTIPLAITNNFTKTSLITNNYSNGHFDYTELSNDIIVLETSSYISSSTCSLTTVSDTLSTTMKSYDISIEAIGHLATDYRIFVYHFALIPKTISPLQITQSTLWSDSKSIVTCQLTLNKSILSPYFQLSIKPNITTLSSSVSSYTIWQDLQSIVYRFPSFQVAFSPTDCANKYTDLCTVVVYMQNSTGLTTNEILFGGYNITSSLQNDNIIIIDNYTKINNQLTIDELNAIQLDIDLERPLEKISICPDNVLSNSDIYFISSSSSSTNITIKDITYPQSSLRCQRWSKPIESTTWNSTQQYIINSNLQVNISGFPFSQTSLSYPLNVLPRYVSPIQIIQSDDCFYLSSSLCTISLIAQHYGLTSRLYLTTLPFNSNIYTFHCTRYITYNKYANSVILSHNKKLLSSTTSPLTFTSLDDLESNNSTLENCTLILRLKAFDINSTIFENPSLSNFTTTNLDSVNPATIVNIDSYTANIASNDIITHSLPWYWKPFSVVFTELQISMEMNDTECNGVSTICTFTITYPPYYGNYNISMISHEIDNITQEYIDPSTLPLIYIQSSINPNVLLNTTISFPSQVLILNNIQDVTLTTTNIISQAPLTVSPTTLAGTSSFWDASTQTFYYGSSLYMNPLFIPSDITYDSSLTYFFAQKLQFTQPLPTIMNSPYYLSNQNLDFTNKLIYEDPTQPIIATFTYSKDPQVAALSGNMALETSPVALSVQNVQLDTALVFDKFQGIWFYSIGIIPYIATPFCLSQFLRFCIFDLAIFTQATSAYVSVAITDTIYDVAIAFGISGCEKLYEDPDNPGYYIYHIFSSECLLVFYKQYSHDTYSSITVSEPYAKVASIVVNNVTTPVSPPAGVTSIVDFSLGVNITTDDTYCNDVASPICILSITFFGPFTTYSITNLQTNESVSDVHIVSIQIPNSDIVISTPIKYSCKAPYSVAASSILTTISYNETAKVPVLALDYPTETSDPVGLGITISTTCTFTWVKQPHSPSQFYGKNLLIESVGLEDLTSKKYYQYWDPIISTLLTISNYENCLQTYTSSSTLCTWGVTMGASTLYPLYEIRGEVLPSINYPYIIPNKRYFCYKTQELAETAALSSTNLEDFSFDSLGNIPSSAILQMNLIDVCVYNFTEGSSSYFIPPNNSDYTSCENGTITPSRKSRMLRFYPVSNTSVTTTQQCYFSFSSLQSTSYTANAKTLVIPYDVSTHTLDYTMNTSIPFYNNWYDNAQNVSGFVTNELALNFTRLSKPQSSTLLTPEANVYLSSDYGTNPFLYVHTTLPISLYGKLLTMSFASLTFSSSAQQTIATRFTLEVNNTVYIDIYDTFPVISPIPCYQLISNSSTSSYTTVSSILVGVLYPSSQTPKSITFSSIPNYTFNITSVGSNIGLRMVMQDSFPSGTQCQADLVYNMLYPTHPKAIQHDVTVVNAKVDMKYNMTNILSTFETSITYPAYVKTSQLISSSSS